MARSLMVGSSTFPVGEVRLTLHWMAIRQFSMVATQQAPLLMAGSRIFPVVAVLPAPLLMPDSRLSTITVLQAAPLLIVASSSFPVVAVLLIPLFKVGFRKLVRGEVQVLRL